MVTPLQKCYDEIAVLKEELKKRDEQIEKLIENNTNLNKKVESLLYMTPFKPKGAPLATPNQKFGAPLRGKVAKLVENYEKNIDKPIPKPIPAPKTKVAKLVENYEKNIDKPISKPIQSPRSKVAKLVENYEKNIDKPIPAPRSNVAKFAENYKKNINKPIPKPRTIKTTPIPKPRTIKTTPIPKPIPAPRTKVTPIVKEIPIPSDYMFIDEEKPEMIKSAFKKTQKRYKINVKYIHSPLDEMKSKKNVIENILKDNLKTMKSFKFNYGLEITFTVMSKVVHTRVDEIKATLWSSPLILLNESEIDEKIELAFENMENRIVLFSITSKSNFIISKINSQYIDILKYKPLKGSSYIELPKELKNPKMGLINIKNEDQICFAYCLLNHLHQNEIKNNPQRVSNYKKYENTVDFTGINFPVSIKDIPKIEKMNNIAINVFGYENKTTFPVFLSASQTENP